MREAAHQFCEVVQHESDEGELGRVVTTLCKREATPLRINNREPSPTTAHSASLVRVFLVIDFQGLSMHLATTLARIGRAVRPIAHSRR